MALQGSITGIKTTSSLRLPCPVPKTVTQKLCLNCKSAGRNPSSHSTSDCWFVSKFEKLQLSKALRVETNYIASEMLDEENHVGNEYSVEYVQTSLSDQPDEHDIVPDDTTELPDAAIILNRLLSSTVSTTMYSLVYWFQNILLYF